MLTRPKETCTAVKLLQKKLEGAEQVSRILSGLTKEVCVNVWLYRYTCVAYIYTSQCQCPTKCLAHADHIHSLLIK